MEVMSLVASIVSVIIGMFAIWLSVTFYRLSNKISEDTKEAAKGISASVDRLESLFDRLYSDTFSMMKDTVSDMRKHIWPEKEQNNDALIAIEKHADDKIEELRSQVTSEISAAIGLVGHTDTKIRDVEERLTGLIDKTIQQSRRVESEAQEEISVVNISNTVLSFLQRYGESSIRRIVVHPLFRRRFDPHSIKNALAFLLENKMIKASGDIGNSETVVRLYENRKEGGSDGETQQHHVQRPR